MDPDCLVGLAAVTAFSVTAAAAAVAAAARAASLRLMPLLLTLMAPGLLRAGSAHVVVAAVAAAALMPVAAVRPFRRSYPWLAGALVCVALRYRRDAVDLSRSVSRTALCAGLCAEPVAAGACPDLLRSGERALAVVTLLWAPGVALTLSRRRRAFDVGCSVGCRAARPRLRVGDPPRWQFCVFVAPACEPIATRGAAKVTNLGERGYAWSTQSPKENWPRVDHCSLLVTHQSGHDFVRSLGLVRASLG